MLQEERHLDTLTFWDQNYSQCKGKASKKHEATTEGMAVWW